MSLGPVLVLTPPSIRGICRADVPTAILIPAASPGQAAHPLHRRRGINTHHALLGPSPAGDESMLCSAPLPSLHYTPKPSC